MKTKIIILTVMTATLQLSVNAQNLAFSPNHNPLAKKESRGNANYFADGIVSKENVASYVTSPDANLQIISPEPIVYVDLSAKWVQGDLPVSNIVRLHPSKEAFRKNGSYLVTVVTKNFLIVYKIYCDQNNRHVNNDTYVIRINPVQAIPVSNTHQLNQNDLYRLATLASLKKNKIKNIKSKKYGINLKVNNIFVSGEYIILDLSAGNRTNLPYVIDQITFTLQDKKQVSAHISQEIDLKPVFSLYPKSDNIFSDKWHNIYIFKKFTFPEAKELNIEMTEKQISGRKINLHIDYNQILKSKKL